MDPDLDALSLLDSHLVAALGATGDHQLGRPTPCADWDLAALIDHVTGGNWFTVLILDGHRADEALAEVMAQFEGGSASLQQATSSVHDQSTAFRRSGALERTWQHVAGDLSGRQILRLRLHDLIVHTWDIEQTLDPPATLPEALIRWGLAELSDATSLTAEHFGLVPDLGSQDTGDPAAAYLGSFGRRP